MNSKSKIMVAVVVGAAFGRSGRCKGCTLKPSRKPTLSARLETLDAAAQTPFFVLLSGAAQKAAGGGHNLRTAGGKVVALEEAPAYQNVWPSPSGTAWRRRRHFITRKPGRTWCPSITEGSQDNTPVCGRSDKIRRHNCVYEAASVDGLV